MALALRACSGIACANCCTVDRQCNKTLRCAAAWACKRNRLLQGEATNNAIATISVAIDYIKRTESATAVFAQTATAICNCYSRMRDGRV